MERPFRAYDGPAPYVFVCYAHDDRAVVYPELTGLREAGFNVWYDEGIAPGSEWSETLAAKIEGSAVFLYFVTPRSVRSEHCRREVNYALEQTCGMLAVHLEPTELPRGLKLTLSNRQAILKYEHPMSAYLEKLSRALRAAEAGPEKSTGSVQLGDWLLDVGSQRLCRGAEEHLLDPKPFSVLLHLIDAAPVAVDTDALLARTWPGVVVGDNTVHQAISALRRALGDDPRQPRYIETLPKRGYRLLSVGESAPTPASVGDDTIRFESIAVLPFQDLSVERDLEALAEAATHQLITRLDELPSVSVASAAAVEPLVARKLAVDEIAVALGTPLILNGYLHRDGDVIEVPVEVVRGVDGHVLWSTTLRRKDDDRSLVVRFIVGELLRFIGAVATEQRRGPEVGEAYRAWLNWHYYRANLRNFDEVRWIERALELAPAYAQGHLEAFDSYFSAAIDGQDPAWIERAHGALRDAVAAGVSEDDPAYRMRLGRYLVYLAGELDRGEPLLRENAVAYAMLLMDSGLPEAARDACERWAAAQPYVYGSWLNLGFARGMCGQLPGAREAYEEGLRRFPDHPYLLLQHARASTFLGDLDAAERMQRRLEGLGARSPGGELGLRENRVRLLVRGERLEEALEGVAALAADGWHAEAGSLYLELDDDRAAAQYELAMTGREVGRRLVASWLHPDPSRAEHPAVRRFLDSLGYTHAWRRELLKRAERGGALA